MDSNNGNILLSICIPTFNRATYLEDTINSIVKQKKFQETNDVEIVISDNCSDDNTKEVSDKFIRTFGNKIRYYRNSENIRDKNFEKVLTYGKGIFLKLNNDTLIHCDNSLEIIIDTIRQNIDKKEIIFFSNAVLKNITKCVCENLDSFVKTVSFFSTWIICFGIWKEDFDSIDGFSRYANFQLIQTDVLFRMISLNRSVLVNNTKIFFSVPSKSIGGYNIYQVFVTNYLGLLKKYRVSNQISKTTLFYEKTKLMMGFVIPWTIAITRNKTQYSFNKKGAAGIILNEYRFHPILYIGLIYFFLKILWVWFKDLFKKNQG